MVSKGIVYCVLGALAFMAAFEIDGHSNNETNKTGLFNSIEKLPVGNVLLLLLIAGLLCYSFWRALQFFLDTENKGSNGKGYLKRSRYLFSALIYLSFAGVAIKALVHPGRKGGDSNQKMVSELMTKPFGEVLVYITAAILAGVGGYQVYYGLSKKYKKHVQKLNLQSNRSKIILTSGIIGYIARGTVWLILAWLVFKAAFHANANEAGDTRKAFDFLESSSYGSLLLGALGAGVILYGIFNFIRAAYERLNLQKV